MANNNVVRRPKLSLAPYTLNSAHLRTPWVIALWSLIYPGFGHLSCGSKIKGMFLFSGELLINWKAHINMGILYSFTGDFQQAKEVLDTQWLLIYCAVLVFSIFDSYRLAVEFNKLSVLADREAAPMVPTALSPVAFNSLEKRNPVVSAFWSMLLPGLGHIYESQIANAAFLIIIGTGIIILSHVLQAIGFTALGDFQQAKSVLNWQWFINLPSFYCYAVWDTYTETIEINKLFEIEQARYFKDNFQSYSFKIPLKQEV